MGSFDVDLVLGRIGSAEGESTNAVMDVLEVSYFDRALSFGELEELVAELDAAYGVS